MLAQPEVSRPLQNGAIAMSRKSNAPQLTQRIKIASSLGKCFRPSSGVTYFFGVSSSDKVSSLFQSSFASCALRELTDK